MAKLLGEWEFGAAFLSDEDIRGGEGVLGCDYSEGVDCRFSDTVLGPLFTTIDLSGSDAAGGGSVGTAATARSMTTTGSINAPEKLVVARGTKLGAVRLDTMASILDGTMEGAGAPYGEAVLQVIYTKAADADEQVSILFRDTIYRVLEDIPETGGFTAGANNESHKYSHIFEGQSDSAATQYIGLGKGSGTVENAINAVVLSGTTDMDASSWQAIGTISGQDVKFTGGAMLGRFPLVGTTAGVYLLDADAQRFRQTMTEVANDTGTDQCYGMANLSIFGGAVFVPMLRGLRIFRPGGANYSVGPETYKFNTSPVKGRYGWAGGSDTWGYLPVYNVNNDDSWICAIRPREPGDPHNQDVSFYPIIFLDGKESKIVHATGLKGGQTRYTLFAGSDSNVGYWYEGNVDRFPDDTGYTYATGGTLYGTRMRRMPDRVKLAQEIRFQTIGMTSSETIAVDLKYTDPKGTEQTVRCGTTVVSNGFHTIRLPGVTMAQDGTMRGGLEVLDVRPVLTFARGGTTTNSPKLKHRRLSLYGEVL